MKVGWEGQYKNMSRLRLDHSTVSEISDGVLASVESVDGQFWGVGVSGGGQTPATVHRAQHPWKSVIEEGCHARLGQNLAVNLGARRTLIGLGCRQPLFRLLHPMFGE